jgi:hypothetical protein
LRAIVDEFASQKDVDRLKQILPQLETDARFSDLHMYVTAKLSSQAPSDLAQIPMSVDDF